jgi:hypothetical protein
VPPVATHLSELTYLFDLPDAPIQVGAHIMSLVPPQPEIVNDFASRQHCSFWASR